MTQSASLQSQKPLSAVRQLAPIGDTKKYIMMRIDHQLFGMVVDEIEDVLRYQEIVPIPMAPKEVLGILNLRGRIVTVIDMRARLGLAPRIDHRQQASIVVEYKGELYSILVDSVSEVIDIIDTDIATNPENLSEQWRDVCRGVYPMEEELMVIVDVRKLLCFAGNLL